MTHKANLEDGAKMVVAKKHGEFTFTHARMQLGQPVECQLRGSLCEEFRRKPAWCRQKMKTHARQPIHFTNYLQGVLEHSFCHSLVLEFALVLVKVVVTPLLCSRLRSEEHTSELQSLMRI